MFPDLGEKKIKMAILRDDEFYPHEYFRLKGFVRIPHYIMQCTSLSMGAKALYGLLLLNGRTGAAWPRQDTLQWMLGGASTRTIRRWLRELEKAGLIRTKQKGRGLSNNYYFLKSHIIGNAPFPLSVPPPLTETTTDPLTDVTDPPSPEPMLGDFATAEEYMDSWRNWALRTYGPTELLKMYGNAEKLRAAVGIEVHKRKGGDLVAVRMKEWNPQV